MLILVRGTYWEVTGFVAYPLGGGLEQRIPVAEASIAEYIPQWETVQIMLEDVPGEPYECMTDQSCRWNGWVIPYFELDVLSRVLSDLDIRWGFLSESEISVWHEELGEELYRISRVPVAGRELWKMDGFCFIEEKSEDADEVS